MPGDVYETFTERPVGRQTAVAARAAGQDGVVSTADLRAAGVGSHQAKRWVAKGMLHPRHPDVYAFGHPNLTLRGRLRAAILAGGEGAALSHRSAAGWWGMLEGHPDTIDVSAPRARRLAKGIRWHRPRPFPFDDTTDHDGLLITTPARTLLDIAATSRDAVRIQKAIAGAERERIFDMRAIERLPAPHPGSRRLRAALADYRAELTWTRPGIEDLAVLALGGAGLRPQVNVLVDGIEVDLWFPEANLVVELDSHRFHATRREFQRDRHKGNALVRAGRRLLRFTFADVALRTPDFVAQVLEVYEAAVR